jgi:hypothetical protein
MKKRRIVAVVLAGVGVAAAAYVATGLVHNSTLATAFERVSPGQKREEVLGMLGAPDESRSKCRDSPSWMGRAVATSTCAEEVQYEATFLPKFWTVGFDKEGRVIAKYEYSSP